MARSATPSRLLAEWAAALAWDDVPPDVRVQVPLRVLDTAGLILVGAGTPAVGAAKALAGSTCHFHAQLRPTAGCTSRARSPW